jgi:thiol-disulfide isomerase/thioredoxin
MQIDLSRKAIWLVVLLAASTARAQAPLALPGCETAPAVQKELDEKLPGKDLQKLKFSEQAARQREVLEELIAKYPREAEPARRLIDFTRWADPQHLPMMQERFHKLATQHPDDPLALYLAGVALFHADTPESIRLLESANGKAPDFGWPSLALANIYSSGKRADKKEMNKNLSAFFSACPTSQNSTAGWLLPKTGDTELQKRVAAALRASLSTETDPKRLRRYQTLWAMEFRLRPPQEHDAIRKQVTEDLKRVEALNPKPDKDWCAFLIAGYKLSGAPPETITAMEDRLVQQYPHSSVSYRIVEQRWNKAHKEPEDQKDAAAWAKYNTEHKEALKGWIRDYPDDFFLKYFIMFNEINSDDSLPQAEGLAVLDNFLAGMDYNPPFGWNYASAGEFLLNHKWQPERAVGLLHKAQGLIDEENARNLRDDNLSAEDAEKQKEQIASQPQDFAGWYLQAAKLTGKLDEVQPFRDTIERQVPADKKTLSEYWTNRANLAALENRKPDALTYFQLALQTRSDPPQAWHGKVSDDLTKDARALWKEMGGSETAWAVWSQPPAATIGGELLEGRWEKPKKPLTSFELADMSGKTWTLKNLEGKSVLINVWATWCEPCQMELPKLEQLYQKIKDRKDIQILTFNYDSDPGLIAPFLKEKGFTFPVLPAFTYVSSMLDEIAIPQNWIVDAKGSWQWTQIGYGAEEKWEQSMLQKMEGPKPVN